MLRRPTTRAWIYQLGLFALSIAVSLVAIEIFARLYEGQRELDEGPGHPPLFRDNSHGTGSYRLIPNAEYKTRIGGKDVIVRTNSFGMPWRDTTIEKPPGIRRIAFVGDSY